MFKKSSGEDYEYDCKELLIGGTGCLGMGVGAIFGLGLSGVGIYLTYLKMVNTVTSDNLNPSYAAGALGLFLGAPVTGCASLFGGVCGLFGGWCSVKTATVAKEVVEGMQAPESQPLLGS